MNEKQQRKDSRHANRNLSLETKKNYCLAWRKSGMNQLDFSKANGISKSALYKWNKEFEKTNKGIDFKPMVLEDHAHEEESGLIQLNIECPNHLRLSITIPEYRLMTFIKEIGYATSTIW